MNIWVPTIAKSNLMNFKLTSLLRLVEQENLIEAKYILMKFIEKRIFIPIEGLNHHFINDPEDW